MQFKVWVEHAKYDQADTSDFAGRRSRCGSTIPRARRSSRRASRPTTTAASPASSPLSKGAMLGVYALQIVDGTTIGGGSFRVEEYKKPEFEVHGRGAEGAGHARREDHRHDQGEVLLRRAGRPAPRSSTRCCAPATTSRWYPRGDLGLVLWPRLLVVRRRLRLVSRLARVGLQAADAGRGGAAATSSRKSCWRTRSRSAPTARCKVAIDTRRPRNCTAIRTISIRSPPRWSTNRGAPSSAPATCWWPASRSRSSPGSIAATTASATRSRPASTPRRSTSKPVEGKGELTLFSISYNDKNEPVEKAVQTWKLDTNVEGKAQQQIKAAEAGQYRLSYKLTDAKEHTIEGGYVFVVRGEGFDGKRLPLQRHRAGHRQARVRPGRQGQAADQHQPQRTARCCCSSGRPTASICRRRCCAWRARASRRRSPSCRRTCPTSSSRR